MFSIGFSSGLPFLMTLTVLDVWLKDVGFSNSTIGLVTLINLPYIFKFLWAPFIDRTDLPKLSKKLGRKKSWTLVSQILITISFFGMSVCDPTKDMLTLISFTLLATFATSCQNIALYSFQIDRLKKQEFGSTAGTVIFGYRIGMLVASSGSLFIAYLYTWKVAYQVIAALVLMCCIILINLPEPEELSLNERKKVQRFTSKCLKKFPGDKSKASTIKAVFFECLICPFLLFKKHRNWLNYLYIIASYKAGDVMIHKMSKPLYLELGFSKPEIAEVVGIVGVIATIAGGLIGSYVVKHFRVKRSMLLCGILHMFMNLAYLILYTLGHNMLCFYITVTIENLSGGMMMTAFLSFLYKICASSYPATQYALLWGLHGISATFFRGISGIVVDNVGWVNFYLIALVLSVPSIICIYLLISNNNANFQQRRI